jgi:hypothetical protein
VQPSTGGHTDVWLRSKVSLTRCDRAWPPGTVPACRRTNEELLPFADHLTADGAQCRYPGCARAVDESTLARWASTRHRLPRPWRPPFSAPLRAAVGSQIGRSSHNMRPISGPLAPRSVARRCHRRQAITGDKRPPSPPECSLRNCGAASTVYHAERRLGARPWSRERASTCPISFAPNVAASAPPIAGLWTRRPPTGRRSKLALPRDGA